MKCCSNCDQGRKQCPTPSACFVCEPEDDLRCADGVLRALAWGAAIWAAGALVYVYLLGGSL
jgi:hypothetical protein